MTTQIITSHREYEGGIIQTKNYSDRINKTYLVMQSVDNIAISMLELKVCRVLHTWPYRLHQEALEYQDAFRPTGMPSHCCSTRRLCSIYQNHCKNRHEKKITHSFIIDFTPKQTNANLILINLSR